jgi:hypothetical protein
MPLFGFKSNNLSLRSLNKGANIADLIISQNSALTINPSAIQLSLYERIELSLRRISGHTDYEAEKVLYH